MNSYTFLDVFGNDIDVKDEKKRVDGIIIPRIQRDYAQGRDTERERDIRERFVSEIFKIISADEEKLMELDFVYGSVRQIKNGETVERRFIPLDGQQRLTTLYLLYWYIGNRELQGDELKELQKKLRNFSYEVRYSSGRFCEKLAEITINFENYPKTELTNSTWYFNTFDNDPTVKSMLTMLDEIHRNYIAVKKMNLYQNLSRIRFYILPLDGFDLTDDLYIKMNARGKELTDFEAFKASLVNYIKDNERNNGSVNAKYKNYAMPWPDVFSIKLDNDWTNFFWYYSRKNEKPEEENNVKFDDIIMDRYYMRFFVRYFFNIFIINSSLSGDKPEKENTFRLYGNQNDDRNVRIRSIDYKNILNINVIKGIERVLDYFTVQENDYLKYKTIIKAEAKYPWDDKEWNFFDVAITQEERIIFLAITLFIENSKDNEFDEIQFARWMRVVRNIVENAGVNTVDSMIGAMRLIGELSKYSADIYTFLAGNTELKSSTARDQVIEERKKAKLIMVDKSGKFEQEIVNAENHPFFRGQIYFLVDISGGDIKEFITYREKAKAVFKKDIEKSPCLFHRALAAFIYKKPIDDYNYYAEDWSSNRRYYLEDEDAIRSYMLRYNENDFYYNLLKQFLDLVDTFNPESSMQALINNVTLNEAEWQTYLINSPHCLNYCEQKLVTVR
ncbi:MAG: DUF262 domain-containing protein, partial [Prevotellaceae bacterium]|nr:DUF262 domain-containing protein [Prevotellaceae bacterium]